MRPTTKLEVEMAIAADKLKIDSLVKVRHYFEPFVVVSLKKRYDDDIWYFIGEQEGVFITFSTERIEVIL